MRPKTEQNEINNKQRQINQTSSQENRYRGPNKTKNNNQSNIKSKERITIKVRHKKKKTFENKPQRAKRLRFQTFTCVAGQPAKRGRWDPPRVAGRTATRSR